jgi:hypothetical protein
MDRPIEAVNEVGGAADRAVPVEAENDTGRGFAGPIVLATLGRTCPVTVTRRAR